MKKKIFIAINIPGKAKNKMGEYQEKITGQFNSSGHDCPIKWTKKDNLHITLLFLGLVDDMEIPELFGIVEEAVSQVEVFDISIDNLSYGPIGVTSPKMIWANIGKNDELIDLQNRIQRAVLDEGYSAETDKKFTPHMTLGRLVQWQFRKIEPEEVPQVDDGVGLGVTVKSIEIMESFAGRGGSEYCILKSINLKS
ncbi:MAG: RNA 2',3'-cyclic phosphodiesterase [Minisyncoccus archaeiphilus]|uniref:RNA 2',3'-cyclic phosphodiesterase n=1 Tax=Minisyncoccus archaeiphilus TaxID=3238481 RepID=UPI002B14C3E0|nr:MAG: RNA 2',3'-cyclic phosphodiesterase [Candidatus Parcubacteria bacterium]